MQKDATIYVAGHRGLVGSAILRALEAEGFSAILTATRDQLDLRDQTAVTCWFALSLVSRNASRALPLVSMSSP